MTSSRLRILPAAMLLLLILSLALSGCFGRSPATPTPTKMVTPVTQATATPRPLATATPIPTAKPTEQPTATPAAPTATSTPKLPTPTSTPTPLMTVVPMDTFMASPDYGVQAFLWWRPEVADRDLTLIQEAGFTWVKQTFDWHTIEGAGKGARDWQKADEVVRLVNEKGLKLLARISMDPEHPVEWAGPPPQNADHFADFLFDMATRYQGMIRAYQVWNEPNLAREWGGQRPNPREYVALLKKAYNAIKRADPNAIVITAGMAPTGTDDATAMPDDVFYEAMYQAMGGNSDGYFDVLGVHGAGFAAPPELDPAAAAADKPRYGGYRFFCFRHVEDIRAIMERYGDADKRVAILEFGWTTDSVNPAYKWHGADAGITEELKGKYLICALEYAKQHWPWVGVMSVITMPNLAWLEDGDPSDEEQYWWAIMEPSPIDQKYLRAAYVLLQNYILRARGFDPAPLPGGGSTEGMCPTM